MLDRLAQAITDHRAGPWTTTGVPRLSLVATDELLPPTRLLYQTAAAAGTRIRAVITWLGDRFAEPVSIDQIAAEAGMSPATLHRHFSAATGMSPPHRRTHQRDPVQP